MQGDDDRNVQFSQMTGLVQLLRAHNVYHEVIVFTDDTHEPLLHKRYLYAFNRLERVHGRYLKGSASAHDRSAAEISARAMALVPDSSGCPTTARTPS